MKLVVTDVEDDKSERLFKIANSWRMASCHLIDTPQKHMCVVRFLEALGYVDQLQYCLDVLPFNRNKI